MRGPPLHPPPATPWDHSVHSHPRGTMVGASLAPSVRSPWHRAGEKLSPANTCQLMEES